MGRTLVTTQGRTIGTTPSEYWTRVAAVAAAGRPDGPGRSSDRHVRQRMVPYVIEDGHDPVDLALAEDHVGRGPDHRRVATADRSTCGSCCPPAAPACTCPRASSR